jgi:hypothetical protein
VVSGSGSMINTVHITVNCNKVEYGSGSDACQSQCFSMLPPGFSENLFSLAALGSSLALESFV